MVLLFTMCFTSQLTAEPQFIGNSIPANFPTYRNQATSKNAAKWGSVESSRDSMNWGSVNSHYTYARERGFPYKFHCLVWGSQEPGWISGLSQRDRYIRFNTGSINPDNLEDTNSYTGNTRSNKSKNIRMGIIIRLNIKTARVSFLL